MDQVRQYGPPPNPAKLSDSRATGYVNEHGDESWELDALEPAVLTALIQDNVLALRAEDIWDAEEEREGAAKAQLKQCSEKWEQGVSSAGMIVRQKRDAAGGPHSDRVYASPLIPIWAAKI